MVMVGIRSAEANGPPSVSQPLELLRRQELLLGAAPAGPFRLLLPLFHSGSGSGHQPACSVSVNGSTPEPCSGCPLPSSC